MTDQRDGSEGALRAGAKAWSSDAGQGLPSGVTLPLWSAAVVIGAFLCAMAAWAAFAELATTMRMSGRLTTANLSHTVQHATGGKIASVEVALFDQVEQGDVLFRFDVSRQQAQLDGATAQAALVRAENAAIKAVLAGEAPKADGAAIAEEFAARADAMAAREATLAARARNTAARLAAAEEEAAALKEALSLTEDRLTRLIPLQAKGTVRDTDIDLLRERALNLKADIAGRKGDATALAAEAESATLDLTQIRADFRQELTARAAANMRRLAELDAQVARLTGEMEAAVVRAPVSGAISALPFGTPHMAANAGATLATIVQPLSEPTVEVRIPARYIDQVSVGQPGKLAIDSLPRRDAPEMEMRLSAVATEAVRDENGSPSYYLATADMADGALLQIRKTMGDRLRLSIDMPVTATLTGPSTTFLDFLLSPIYALGDNAFEAG